MEIHYYGANCVKLSDKKIGLIIDDNLDSLGLKAITGPRDVSIFTTHFDKQTAGYFIIDGPGEYEIGAASIRGIAAKAHYDNQVSNTIYSVELDDFNIGIIGHIQADLSDEQLEALGVVDVLVIPVGDYGYTLDADEAVTIIKKIEPKIAVPTHFADQSVKYPIPQADLQLFLKALGISEPDYRDNLALKEKDLGDKLKAVILKRTVIK